MKVAQILGMNKGDGETSYAKNSALQSKILSDSKWITEEAIEAVISSSSSSAPRRIAIADLGCSSGPNSLLLISDTVHLLNAKCKHLGYPLPEVLVFLNDLFSNDFNYLFGSLPDLYRRLKADNGDEVGPCFISGMPGSFYGRLFPRNSLHFVHSSSSLHWLSKVPAGLDGEGGPMINKGKIYISPTSPQSVLEAYAAQFRNDFSSFLKSRFEEMTSGGRMVLSLVRRKCMDPTTTDSCGYWELLAQALTSLVSQGMVEEEKVDSFNLPYYAPCIEEVKLEIEKEGSFIIDRFEAFEVEWVGSAEDAQNGHTVAKTMRAVVENMLESHFGGDIMDDLFELYGVFLEDYFSRNKDETIHTNLVVSLVKK